MIRHLQQLKNASKLLAFSSLLALTACGTFNQAAPDTRVLCPDYSIIKEVSVLEIDDAKMPEKKWRGRISGLAAECTPDKGKTNMAFAVRLELFRPDAKSTPRAPFEYFIAIADRDNNILTRQDMMVKADFKDNQVVWVGIDEIDIDLPGNSGVMGEYKVLVGFLEPEAPPAPEPAAAPAAEEPKAAEKPPEPAKKPVKKKRKAKVKSKLKAPKPAAQTKILMQPEAAPASTAPAATSPAPATSTPAAAPPTPANTPPAAPATATPPANAPTLAK